MFNNTAFIGAGQPPAPPLFGIPDVVDLGGAYACAPYGRVFFVRGDSSGVVPNLDDQYTANLPGGQRCYPTVKSILDAGLCKASRGDIIHVLPGHVESIAAADAWEFVAGLRIIGHGYGNTRPTFTFTAATSTLLLDAAALSVTNCRFLCAGPAGTTALTVAGPFVVTGEGCRFMGSRFEIGIDADQLCTLPFTVKAANCGFYGNEILAAAAAAPVSSVVLLGSATTGADGFTFVGNTVKAATSGAEVGLIANITSTASSKDIRIEGNYLHNWLANSSAVISMAGDMVTTGVVRENLFKVELNSSVQGVVYSGTGVDLALDNNRISNVANETAKQNQGTVSA